jgi:hypothetical protein
MPSQYDQNSVESIISNLPDVGPSQDMAQPSGQGNLHQKMAMDFLNSPDEEAPAVAAQPSKAGTPTKFHQAGTPHPAEPEPSWGETGKQALGNLIPSSVEAGKAMVGAVIHPVDTLSSLRDLGVGGLSQAAGALGLQQDPVAKAEREKLINALEDHYAETYGSTKGFKQALAKDPASILMDASTFLGGAGAAGKAAGLGKLGKFVSKASQFTDPIQLALKTAALPVKAVSKITPYIQSATTGASVDSLINAAKAGAAKDPAMRKLFESHRTGVADPSDLVDAVEQAIKSKADRRSAEYVASQQNLFGGNLPSLDWNPILNAYRSARNSITNKKTGTIVLNSQAGAAMKEVNQAIYDFRSAGAHTVEDFDDLKKKIGDIRSQYGSDAQATRVTTEMYQSVIDSIAKKHPEYKDIMKRYGDASDEIFQLKKGFAVGRKSSDESVLRKLLSHGKSKNKQNLLQELAAENPKIPYMLAGQELHNWLPGGTQQLGHLLTASLYGANPIGLAAQGVLASPRLMGKANYTAGRAARNISNVTQPAATRGAYYAGRAGEENQPQAPVESQAEAPVEGGDTFDKMLGLESGNKQLDENGNPITSKKGAIGIAQVMPKTAPEAAKMAGLEWDENKYRTDAEYNKALGRAYYDNMLQRFKDPLIAAAAYNAGPGAVEAAIRRSQSEGGDYLSYLPQETRDYVARLGGQPAATGGRIERASGGSVSRHEMLVGRLMQKAKLAKTASDKATEPLLNAPDHAVVKALDIAQQAI